MADGGEREAPVESSQEDAEAMDTEQSEEQQNSVGEIGGEGTFSANFYDRLGLISPDTHDLPVLLGHCFVEDYWCRAGS